LGNYLQMNTHDMDDVRTTGHLFPDGTVIELMRNASNQNTALLRWKDEHFEIADRVEYSGTTYAAAPIAPSIVRASRLPARIGPPETTEKLFGDLHAFFNSRSGQLDSCITPLVFAVFASWLSPVLPIAPVVSIFAPPGSPKARILHLLGMVCRRPLCLVGLTRSEMMRLPWSLSPTLLLDELDSQSGMQTILRASSQRGMHVAARGEILDLFGPKIIFSGSPLCGASFEGAVLRTALIPISGNVPPVEKREEQDLAERFQARFLGYFLRNFSSVRVPDFDVSPLALPIQGVAQTLGSAVVGSKELQARILPILAVQDEEVRAARACSLDSVVLEAILFFIHRGDWSKVRTQNLAEKVTEIYKGRGSDRTDVSAESVGWAIRRLGIPSGRINKAGNGVELTPEVCRLVHRLALSYGVRAMQSGFRRGCRYCEELESAANRRPSDVALSGALGG
jgi:hypothetical protein